MDPFAGYAAIQSQQHFWQELDEVLDEPLLRSDVNRDGSASSAALSSSLQRYLALTDACYDRYLDHEYNRAYTVKRLLDSALFSPANEEASAEGVVEQLRTATSLRKVLICYDIILEYGQRNPAIHRLIQTRIKDILFRLVHQIWAGFYATQAEDRIIAEEAASRGKSRIGESLHFEYARRAASEASAAKLSPQPGWNGADWDHNVTEAPRMLFSSTAIASSEVRVGEPSSASIMRHLQIQLRSKAVRMMYEVCRVQKLENVEMRPLDRKFLNHLFDLVEQTREHADDSFNYQLIKLIVAINEQFMVAGFANGDSAQVKNTVLDVFRTRLNVSKTFGENLIFMLNRASSGDAEDICMQLLVLKLLYLLFTTEDTAHYFYTNDLKVLVDVFIRELSDLPEESESLRHTYLRVLHPLLTNTQLCTVPYKRPQIRRLLLALVSQEHIRDVSATTKRLVDRCLRAEWCVTLDHLTQGTPQAGPPALHSGDHLGVALAKVERVSGSGDTVVKAIQTTSTIDGASALTADSGDRPSNLRTGTTLAVAAANVEERALSVTSALEVPGTLTCSPQPSPSVANEDRSFDSDISEGLRRQLAVSSSTASLPISTSRTRDKRVSSVSHPRPPGIERSRGSTPSSAVGLHSSSLDVRTAPPTPPRRGSFSRSTSGNNNTIGPDSDSVSSHSTSASSSWHNNLVEATGVQSHAKVRSLLVPGSRGFAKESHHGRAHTTDGHTQAPEFSPTSLPEATLPLPSLHVQDSSHGTIRNGRAGSDVPTLATLPRSAAPNLTGSQGLSAPDVAGDGAHLRRIRSHSQLAGSATYGADLAHRSTDTPSPTPQNGRRRPPPPPVAAQPSSGSSTPSLIAIASQSLTGSGLSPTLTAQQVYHSSQTLGTGRGSHPPVLSPPPALSPPPVRAPPPINRATKGSRSPGGAMTPVGTTSPVPPQTSFDRHVRYPPPASDQG